MASSNTFPHGLNNWSPEDKPTRLDFVSDNQIIDSNAMWKSDYASNIEGKVNEALSADSAINAVKADTADSADKLTTPRAIQTHLESTLAADFDGTANITPGVTGVLPIANGGTGASNGIHWDNVTGRPASFAPSAHNQSASTITSGTFPGTVLNQVANVYDSIKRIYTQTSGGAAVGTYGLVTRRK